MLLDKSEKRYKNILFFKNHLDLPDIAELQFHLCPQEGDISELYPGGAGGEAILVLSEFPEQLVACFCQAAVTIS